MSAPFLVTVFVGVGLASSPETVAMRDAMTETLGPDATVRIQEGSEPGLEAQALAETDPRNAMAWLEWADDASLQATLHVRKERSVTWQVRTIRFQASDEMLERSRALGFVLAAILRPESALPASPVAPPVVARAGESPRRWALEALGIASAGLGGTAGGLGGALALRRRLAPWLGLRLGLAARTGDVAAAQATSLSFGATLGASARWLASHHFAFGGRLDGGLFYQSVSRSSDSGKARQSHLLPGAAVMLESAYSFAAGKEIVLDLGAEVAFGQISIYVDDQKAATIPASRGVAELGLRLSF
jgi:hypothetical protein